METFSKIYTHEDTRTKEKTRANENICFRVLFHLSVFFAFFFGLLSYQRYQHMFSFNNDEKTKINGVRVDSVRSSCCLDKSRHRSFLAPIRTPIVSFFSENCAQFSLVSEIELKLTFHLNETGLFSELHFVLFFIVFEQNHFHIHKLLLCFITHPSKNSKRIKCDEQS